MYYASRSNDNPLQHCQHLRDCVDANEKTSKDHLWFQNCGVYFFDNAIFDVDEFGAISPMEDTTQSSVVVNSLIVVRIRRAEFSEFLLNINKV